MLYANRRAWQALVMTYELRGGAGPEDVLRGPSRASADNFWGADCAKPTACFGDPARVWVVAIGSPADPLAHAAGPLGPTARPLPEAPRLAALLRHRTRHPGRQVPYRFQSDVG
jgi:mannosyltransferase